MTSEGRSVADLTREPATKDEILNLWNGTTGAGAIRAELDARVQLDPPVIDVIAAVFVGEDVSSGAKARALAGVALRDLEAKGYVVVRHDLTLHAYDAGKHDGRRSR